MSLSQLLKLRTTSGSASRSTPPSSSPAFLHFGICSLRSFHASLSRPTTPRQIPPTISTGRHVLFAMPPATSTRPAAPSAAAKQAHILCAAKPVAPPRAQIETAMRSSCSTTSGLAASPRRQMWLSATTVWRKGLRREELRSRRQNKWCVEDEDDRTLAKDIPIPFVNPGGGLWLRRARQINPFVCDFCLARQSLTL